MSPDLASDDAAALEGDAALADGAPLNGAASRNNGFAHTDDATFGDGATRHNDAVLGSDTAQSDDEALRTRRGVLYPQRLPEFHRVPAPPQLEYAVRWFWIPEWNLPPGEVSTQEILPFPACNMVIDSQGIMVSGPSTRRSERQLTGTGWAVGALIRAAAAPLLFGEVASLRDTTLTVEDRALQSAVSRAMGDETGPAADRRSSAVAVFASWLLARAAPPLPGSDGAIASELERLLADPSITRVDQLPPLLHLSGRSLQRLADRHFGVPLHAMIRRRRLQEAAERLREDPHFSIAALATELGYADHAHFSKDFKAQLGLTPSHYRAAQ